PPNPLPEAERGQVSPPLRFGEGVGGWGSVRVRRLGKTDTLSRGVRRTGPCRTTAPENETGRTTRLALCRRTGVYYICLIWGVAKNANASTSRNLAQESAPWPT